MVIYSRLSPFSRSASFLPFPSLLLLFLLLSLLLCLLLFLLLRLLLCLLLFLLLCLLLFLLFILLLLPSICPLVLSLCL